MGLELRDTAADLALAVYPHLRFGMFFKIPNDESGFGSSTPGWWHPWVIVVPYHPGLHAVVACPRTSTGAARGDGRTLWTPGGIVPGLERDGVVLLHRSQLFPVVNFRSPSYERLGCLPEQWQDRLRAALAPFEQAITRLSEDS